MIKNTGRRLFIFWAILFFFTLNAHAPVDPDQKIISLAPYITEEIYLLGLDQQLVACTRYCQRPPQANKKLKIADAVNVNVEMAFKLNPDLILADDLTNAKDIQKMKNLGLRVVQFPQAEDFAQVCRIFRQIAALTGREQEGVAIITQAENRVKRLTASVPRQSRPSCFMQIGANPLFTITRHSFINDLLDKAGLDNIAGNASSGLYSREMVISQNPDIIIVVTMGIQGKKEIELWQKFSAIKAVKNKRIYQVDADIFCSPTPISFADALQELINIIYKQ